MSLRLTTLLLALLVGCSSGSAPEGTRTYRLGFSATSPRPTTESQLATLRAWRPYADVALVSQWVPWRALLADTSAAALVSRDLAPIVGAYRQRGLPVIVQLEATDGLAREREAPELVALGRSIAEPVVQARYREYVLAVDSMLHPEWLGLAAETNLVRALAPPGTYAALVTMTNDGAAALAARGSTARRFVNVQAETAWGRLLGNGPFVGIARDRADFPFMQAIGVSSYPFLGFADPEEVPLDYYARLEEGGARLPMLVTEGGWTSASVGAVTSSPEKQARWIRRQMQLADRVPMAAITQIVFTDLDLSSYWVPDGSILPLFAQLGLVDTELRPKPALAEWERAMGRRLVAR